MESVITYPISAFTKPKLGRLNFSAKEIADGSFLFTHQNSLQLSISNIRGDGNRRARPAQRNSESGRSINGDDNNNKTPQSSEGSKTTHNKEEILALFRRIQSSISGETVSKGRTNNNPSADSVLEVLRQSRKTVKGKTTSNREGSIALGERKKEAKKEEKINFASLEAKTSRPPSNFVKRSPIPSTFVEKVQDEVKSATNGEDLETMKLVALKELARSRGIKGYSKLKKGELIELLKVA